MSAAYRGTRPHQGLDIKCSDGDAVYAPFDVTLNGRLTVYTDPNKAAINEGINLSGEGGSSRAAALTELLILVLIRWSRRCVCVLQVFVSSCSTWGRTEPQERRGRGRGSAPCCPCRAFIRESPHTSTSRCATGWSTPHNTSDLLQTPSTTFITKEAFLWNFSSSSI